MKKCIAPFLLAPILVALIVACHLHRPISERSAARPSAREGTQDDLGESSAAEPETLWQQRYRELLANSNDEMRLKLVRQEYKRHAAELTLLSASPADDSPVWASLGPTNASGRITSIAFPENDARTIYVGADTGGVWKSNDAGDSWIPLTDSIPSLEVGALAVSRSSPNVIYLGTGTRLPGIGLLKSTDAGVSWSLPDSLLAPQIYRISIHPANPLELVVVTSGGGFRSTDGGSTWAQVIPLFPYNSVRDLVRDPTAPQILYATTTSSLIGQNFGGGLVLKSTDAGQTWSEKTTGLNRNPSPYGISIAISPTSPQVLYAATAVRDPLTGDTPTHVYKSTDAGQSWTDLLFVAQNQDFSISHVTGGNQTNHNNAVAVSPADPNTVNVAGVWYIRSTDGGATWQEPLPSGPYIHPDAADMRYRGAKLFIGNDGGLWSSSDDGQTAVPHNAGLVARQYYTVASDPNDPNRLLAGCQDSGTDMRPMSGGTTFSQIFGSDGFDCAISSGNPSLAYATVLAGQIVRAKAGDLPNPTWKSINPPYVPGERTTPNTLLKMDVHSSATLYTASTRVWRTTDTGDSWKALPTNTTDGSVFGDTRVISDLAVSQDNGQTLMAIKDTSLFRSTNGGETWVSISTIPGAPQSIEIDPTNPAIAYVVVQLNSSQGVTSNLYATSDGGTSWHLLGAGLPALFLSRVRVDPRDSEILYCGTAAGLYRSIDKGTSWTKFGLGLPNVLVLDFGFSVDGSLLRAPTFGRGLWQVQIRPSAATPDFSISFDQPTLNAGQGTKVKATVNINRTGGFSGNVTVTPPRAAMGVKAKPPDPITTGDSSVTFKLKITGAAPTGPHPLTFSAVDESGRTRTATLTLVVQ